MTNILAFRFPPWVSLLGSFCYSNHPIEDLFEKVTIENNGNPSRFPGGHTLKVPYTIVIGVITQLS